MRKLLTFALLAAAATAGLTWLMEGSRPAHAVEICPR